ncbi:uncharacterized protein PgNI_00813 [Pyricularia grisea]|uniref:Uncharacterized protein n=1 Tax=Pyricularia grisea TaxID=148305 RepID=A0A6P8BJL4_PYRGI|nr:uncharacterized protein PgNI_00813 [Pyricularia grisea]TLD16874.1 hypothetical protein PgNI_00813 [Pyricularia grisea]
MSHESAVPPNRELCCPESIICSLDTLLSCNSRSIADASSELAEDLIEHLPANRSQDPSAAASLLTSVRKHIKSISQQQPQNSLYGDIDIDRLGTNL